MSRIFEALQRAEAERGNLGNLDEALAFNEPMVPTVCEPLPIESPLDFEKLATHPWSPSIAELPVLAGGGKSVEQFRRLRSHLYMQRLQQDLKTVLVTSGLPAEGKTFIAVNLTMSLAHHSDRSVLLVDADLRRPSAHRLLGSSASPGLAEYLEGKASLPEIVQRGANPTCAGIQQSQYSNVAFIPAGRCSNNALELVCSHRIDELMSQLAPLFDWIILDSPPVLAVTDAVDLARAVDAVLLVARAGSTPYSVAQKLQQTFSNSRLLGFVLNAVKDAPRNDDYSAYYYQNDEETQKASRWRHSKRNRE